MNDKEREGLQTEAAQLEKSIAEAAASGALVRAQKLTERRERVLARLTETY